MLFLGMLTALVALAAAQCASNPVLSVIPAQENTCTAGQLDLSTNRITHVADPEDDTDVATRGYTRNVVTSDLFQPFVLTDNTTILVETWTCNTTGYAYTEYYFATYTAWHARLMEAPGCVYWSGYCNRGNLTKDDDNTVPWTLFRNTGKTLNGTREWWVFFAQRGHAGGTKVNYYEMYTFVAKSPTRGHMLTQWKTGTNPARGALFLNDRVMAADVLEHTSLSTVSLFTVETGDRLRLLWGRSAQPTTIIGAYTSGFTQTYMP